MTESILDGKRILVVDDEPDILNILEDEISGTCPKCKMDKAISYETALHMLKSQDYDMVILDIMGVRGFDLLDVAVKQNLPVAMLTAHALNPEALKRSFQMGARAYLPKERLGEIVPFLENILEETDNPPSYLKTWLEHRRHRRGRRPLRRGRLGRQAAAR